jgi:hypothetical protein
VLPEASPHLDGSLLASLWLELRRNSGDLAGLAEHLEVVPPKPASTTRIQSRAYDEFDAFVPSPPRMLMSFAWDTPGYLSAPRDPEKLARLKEIQRAFERLTVGFARVGEAVQMSPWAEVHELRQWASLNLGEHLETVHVSTSPAENAQAILKAAGTARAWLEEAGRRCPRRGSLIRVIDTSALMECCEPRSYGDGAFEFVLPRSVLQEVDNLAHASNPKRAETARGIKRRIRDWSSRGDPYVGVREDRSILIRLVDDASMALAPPFLDAGKADDRIVWTALSLAYERPACCVRLVAEDISLAALGRRLGVAVELAPPGAAA